MRNDDLIYPSAVVIDQPFVVNTKAALKQEAAQSRLTRHGLQDQADVFIFNIFRIAEDACDKLAAHAENKNILRREVGGSVQSVGKP